MTSIFTQDVQELVTTLRGLTLSLPDGRMVTITQTVPYRRSDNDTGIYKPVLEMRPGEVYVARSRNSFLFLVVALDQGVSGGCVLIKGIKFDDQEIRGAGRVSTVLGFDEHGLTGRIKETDSSGLELQVDGILSPGTVASSGMPAEKPAAAEQLPSSVLQQYLGQITTRFTEEATPDESFDNYLSRIATDHPTEAELRAWLDS